MINDNDAKGKKKLQKAVGETLEGAMAFKKSAKTQYVLQKTFIMLSRPTPSEKLCRILYSVLFFVFEIRILDFSKNFDL